MDKSGQSPPTMFINAVDQNMRDNIIKLDQKLKGLKAEIAAKLSNSSWYEGDDATQYTERLTAVAQEVDMAIEGINNLVTLVGSEEQELRNSFLQSSAVKEFSKTIEEHLERITQIKESF